MREITEKVEENKTKGHKIKIYCSQCNSITNHIVMQSIDVEEEEVIDTHYGIDSKDHYQIVKCQGCDSITFRHQNWCSENMFQISQDEWEDGNTEYLYPERSIHTRALKPFKNLPRRISKIYSETTNCFNKDFRILCAAGLRAIIEGICSEQGIKDGPIFLEDGVTQKLKRDGITPVRSESLQGKIAGLHEKGILTKSSANMLHEYRFLGNDAIHDLQLPTKDVLGLAIDIVEHMLESLYVIPDKAEDLRIKRVKQSKKS